MLRPEAAVLFADDNRDDRYLHGEAYKQAGILNPCTMVEDGDQVVGYLEGAGAYSDREAHPLPGLIVLDLKMPRKNGIEALAWIRASERWSGTPVIMLSASMHPGDIRQAYAAGANAFLVKPSSIQELVELMTSLKSFWLRFAEYPREI